MILQLLTIIISLVIFILSTSIEKSNDDCPKYENCLFYQITQNYTDYGCGVCEKEYAMSADASGSGECFDKHKIKNCVGSVSKADILDGTPFCFECEKDFILKNNSMNCGLVPRNKRIRNCKNYYANNTNIFCNVCEDGYTLDETRKRCIFGCSVPNCKNCQLLGGKSYCFNCKNGYIGVADEKMMIYRDCLNCDTYKQNKRIMSSRANTNMPSTPPNNGS